MVSPARRFLTENFALYYPFGNTRSRNILADYSNRLDNKDNDVVTTKILFLGSGDLRSAFQATTNNRQRQRLHIHLNDHNESVVARNVMVLSIVSAPEFNPEDENDFAFLWDLWYNSEWPETTRIRFQRVLKDLLDGGLRGNIVIAKTDHLQILRKTWRSWQATASRSPMDSASLMGKIDRERLEFIFQGLMRTGNKVSSTSQALNEIADELVTTIGSHGNLTNSSLKQKIFAEARSFMERGHCRLRKEKVVCVNPTLLHPRTLRWHVHFMLFPYSGYLPLSPEEMDVTVRTQILIRSCQGILKGLVSSYRRRLKDVKVFFHLEDALEYCYTERNIKFDVIGCTNISDYVGLVNLLNACKLRLADHEDALISTEIINWGYMTPLSYVEELLCFPSSMIPTIYGLRLANHALVGERNSDPVKLSFLSICWKNATPLTNVVRYSSPTLTKGLLKLASKSYLMQGQNSMDKFWTPLTFEYVTNLGAERISGGHSWLNDVKRQIFGTNSPSVFCLSKRTIESWADGQLILKLTGDVKFDDAKGFGDNIHRLSKSTLLGVASLRLVLIPRIAINSDRSCFDTDLLETIIFLNSDVHFIDNLQLEMTKASDDSIESASISFLLVPDHGLEETHFGIVLDLGSRLPIFYIENMSKLRVEKFLLPYPFERKKSSILPLSTGEESEVLVADSCVETENDYTIKVNIISRCKDPVSGLNVSTDWRKPLKSANELTVSISQPKSIKPLKITLPFPFIVDSMRATLHRRDRLVVLVLQKALGLEPWPCDINHEEKYVGGTSETSNRQVGVCCAACEITLPILKRCSRCLAISYCSVECQRAHWTLHKKACVSSGKK